MILIVSKYLVPKGYRGLTIFPFVLVRGIKESEEKALINHEKIHIRQQLELLVLPFFIWYFMEFLVRWMYYKNRYLAYRNISFEREAYANEYDFYYLKSRPFFGFMKYLVKKKV